MVDPARRMEQLSYGMDTPGLPVLLTSHRLSGDQRDWKRRNAVTGIEVKVRATIICSQQRDRYFAAKMLFLIMILPAEVRSDEDGANLMGLYLIAACRISF